jgi:phosphoribosylamine--glycine ligase
VLASAGYPGSYQTGIAIKGLDRIAPDENGSALQIFHAGTSVSSDGEFLTTGGRVLGVTATGETLQQALDSCYLGVEGINFDGMQYRRDIGQFREI